MNDTVKTPDQLAQELEQTRREAAEAMRGHAREAAHIGHDTAQALRGEWADARATGREAMGTAQGVAADLRDSAREAGRTGKAYARQAADATAQRMQDWKTRAASLQDDCTDYVRREPVKGALYAAAGGAVLAMVLQAAMRRGSARRYHDYAD